MASTDDEAREVFEKLGCTSCHNDNVAVNWDGIVRWIEESRTKYGSIDEAAKDVQYFGQKKFGSFKELMETMAKNVGKSYSDEDIQLLEKYFIEKFSGGTVTTTEISISETSKPATSPTETETTRETTKTPSTPVVTTSKETQPTTTLREEKSYFLPVVAIAVIIIVVVLVVTTRK